MRNYRYLTLADREKLEVFSQRIKELRKNLNLSQKEIANKLNVLQVSIYN